MAENEWACERCTYLNANSTNQCVMCEWEEPTTQGVAAGHRLPTTTRPLVIGAASPPEPSTATPTDTRSAVMRQLPVRSPPSDYRGGAVTGGETQAQGGNDSTWEIFLMGLVGRIATPAKFIFNGTLTSVVAFAGACTGAVAGAIAARATRRGVMRGAGIGALAGAAISIEALDLGRLILRGYTVAGATDHRETRLGTFDHAAATAAAAGRAGHIRSVRARRGGGGAPHRGHATLHHIEIALAEGDVELVLHELLAGVLLSHTRIQNQVHWEGHGAGGTAARSWRIPGDVDGDGDVSGDGRRPAAAAAGDGAGNGAGGSGGDSGDPARAAVGVGGEMPRRGPVPTRQRRRQSQMHQLLEAILVQANVDSMSYEDLLERFGPGVDGPAAAPASLISAIPRRKLTGDDVEASLRDGEREWRCCICLEDYCKGDVVKSLPTCAHCFHAGCIDTWLAGRNLCPICRVAGVVHAGEAAADTAADTAA